MFAFLSVGKPVSINCKSATKTKYQARLRRDFQSAYPGASPTGKMLYGVVYYVKKSVLDRLDADNLSKPVWDALNGCAYTDDELVMLRHAGIIDLDLTPLSLSRLPDGLADRMIELAGKEPEWLYIELGELDNKMYKFSYDRD